MDPLDRADAALARARARGAFVVTPEDAVSPMDAASTLQIPRTVVAEIDRAEGDLGDTMVVSQSQPTQQQPHPKARRPQPPQPAGHQQQSPPQQEPQHHQQGHQVTEQFEQPQPPLRQEKGMVPTVKRPPTDSRPSLTQRLDGQRRSPA